MAIHPSALRTATRYRVLLLGPFRLERDGDPIDISAWQPRVRALFKLLVTAPDRQRLRDDLIDILWPDAPPDTGPGNLRMLVHRLRLVLAGTAGLGLRGTPSPILSDHGWISLNPAYDWEVDLDRLEAALSDPRGDIGNLEQAAALYRGEPLIEDRYDDWAASVRERAQRNWRDLCLRLASLYGTRGSFDEAVRWHERALEIDPLDEEALRGLLVALSLAGRQADAARRYQQFEHRLTKEVDVPPSPETLELIQGIRTQLSGSTSKAPRGREGSLPVGGFLGSVPEGPLIGREEELERIFFAVDAVESGSGRLVLIAGEPGLGKTRLAQEVMVRLLDRGFVVLTSSCYEQHRAVPFHPFLDLLARAYAAAPPTIRRQALKRWPHLAELLPDETSAVESTDSKEEDEQHRLFRAVTGFLSAIAAHQPVALLLDDVQWADDGSLELLHYLARHARGSRILVLGTYRDSDISNEHPLGRAVRTLSREGLLERLTVRTLSPEKTAALVTALVGEMAGAQEFADFVYRRTKGSPYFINKMVQAIGGRYRLVRQIGMGGMGRVFEALDVQTGEMVAAKVMFSRTEADPKALLRFQQEAAVLAVLDHPNIVKIHGTIIDEHTSCIVMDLLEGHSLGHIVRDPEQAQRRSLASIKTLMQQVASALASAHERGIVHRDVKPDNIIVSADDQVTVTDFGIARLVRPRGETSMLTSTGMTMGTPLYMAPEQIEGKKVDGRADIYALGAVLYQLVTGWPPFEGDDPLSIAFKHVHQPPDPPSWLNADVPEDWEALILKSLAKNPADRFQSAVAVERAIGALGTTGASATDGRTGRSASKQQPRPGPPPPFGPSAGRPMETASRSPRLRRTFFGGLAALAIGGVAALLILERQATPSRRAASHALTSTVVRSETSLGTGPGQFDGPTGVALDVRGNVYVVDQGNDRIQELSPDGKPLHQWGTPGKGSLQFDSPSDLAIGSDGTIYVSDIGNKRIAKLHFGRQVNSVEFDGGGLAVGPRGNLFATDYFYSQLQKFYPSGDWMTTIRIPQVTAGNFPFPAGLAVDARGNIYVADREHNRILKISPTGRLLSSFGRFGRAPGQFDKPTDIALDARGNIYVADARNDRVQKLSPTGKPLAAWGSLGSGLGQFIQPVGIAVDDQGNVYVSDYYNDRVQKFDPSGRPLWATQGQHPMRRLP